MDLQTISIVIGIIVGLITIGGAIGGGGLWLWRRFRRNAPSVAPPIEYEKLANELLKKFKAEVAAPEGAADIGTEELAKAAGPDTGARLREAVELQAQHREREAIECLYEAFRKDLEPDAKIELHILLGNSFLALSQLKEAEGHYRQAMDASRDAHFREGEAASLGNLGLIYADQGGLERAEEHYNDALTIQREIGHRRGESQNLGNLGIVYSNQGNLQRAEQHFQAAVTIQREIGHRLGEASTLGNLGNVHADQGDPKRAEEHYQAALAIQREIGHRLGEANGLGSLGILAAQRDQRDEACRLLKQAAAIFDDIGAGGEGPEAVRAALGKLGCD